MVKELPAAQEVERGKRSLEKVIGLLNLPKLTDEGRADLEYIADNISLTLSMLCPDDPEVIALKRLYLEATKGRVK